MKAEKEEAAEVGFEVSTYWFKGFKERICLHNTKVQSETASIDREVAVSYLEDVAKITDEGADIKQ